MVDQAKVQMVELAKAAELHRQRRLMQQSLDQLRLKPGTVGQSELFIATYAHVTARIPNLTIDVNSDMTNNHSIQEVDVIIGASNAPPAAGDGTPCTDDGDGDYSCGAVPNGQTAVVLLLGCTNKRRQFQPGWSTFSDQLGADDWYEIASGELSWNETVNAS